MHKRETCSALRNLASSKLRVPGCGKEASDQKNQNWGYYEAKWLVEIWDYEEIQRQLSAISRNPECLGEQYHKT